MLNKDTNYVMIERNASTGHGGVKCAFKVYLVIKGIVVYAAINKNDFDGFSSYYNAKDYAETLAKLFNYEVIED